jgi:hypothetical protein
MRDREREGLPRFDDEWEPIPLPLIQDWPLPRPRSLDEDDEAPAPNVVEIDLI